MYTVYVLRLNCRHEERSFEHFDDARNFAKIFIKDKSNTINKVEIYKDAKRDRRSKLFVIDFYDDGAARLVHDYTIPKMKLL